MNNRFFNFIIRHALHVPFNDEAQDRMIEYAKLYASDIDAYNEAVLNDANGRAVPRF